MKRRAFVRAIGGAAAAALAGARPSALVASIAVRAPAPRDLRFIERWSWAMGQPVHLQLYASSDDHGYEAAAAALAELRRVESALSLFDDASDLVALNRRAGRDALRVGPDLARVLAAGERFRADTAGAFDPAVEPLMRAWGFHARRTREPSRAEIAEARAAVLAATVRVDGDRVLLASAQTQIDLGGIGVGYGLDRAAGVLRRHGIERALLDVSGDLIALGAPPGESGWAVGVADPSRRRPALAEVRLRDRALATSANTESVVRYGRAVRGHVMDPHTGYPAAALVQVTAVAESGIAADALSTAMLVSGRRERGVVWSWEVRA
jgi:thiamine biosynthesis lipoprotein